MAKGTYQERTGRRPGTWEEVNFYDRNRRFTNTEIETAYRTLAKRVNQRLVRLDQAKVKTGRFEAVTYLRSVGRRRFKERIRIESKEEMKRIRKELTIMQGFLSSSRSTMGGRKAILKAIGKTMDDRYGVKLSQQNLDDFLNSFEDTKAAAPFGSEQILKILGTVTNEKTKKETLNDILDEISSSKSMKDAASRVASVKGVTASAGDILEALVK